MPGIATLLHMLCRAHAESSSGGGLRQLRLRDTRVTGRGIKALLQVHLKIIGWQGSLVKRVSWYSHGRSAVHAQCGVLGHWLAGDLLSPVQHWCGMHHWKARGALATRPLKPRQGPQNQQPAPERCRDEH